MSLINSNVVRIYGGNPSGDQEVQQGEFSPSNQYVTEALAVGTYRRAILGPKRTGHYSLEVFVDSVAGAASAMTVWYSNLPNPSLASDADWFQDATVGSMDLTSAATKMPIVGNVFVEWIMVKAVIAVTGGSVRVFGRTEGTTI